MNITKLDGTIEPFDPNKLDTSLARSGASESVRKQVITQIESELVENMSTSVIYRKAFRMLAKLEEQPDVRFRYSLRRAISDFGPSGFPFEKFVGEVYRLKGYKVQVGQKLRGKCVSHEMDIIADRDNERLTAELKFHNKLSLKSDLKVILYVRARFDDLIAGGSYEDKTPRLAIITNTKFSSNAMRYGECAGLELIGWNHPRNEGNLHDLIMQSGIHPLTALSSLSKKQKRYFLEQGLVLCQELSADNAQALYQANAVLPKHKVQKVLDEIKQICECVGPTCEV